MAGGGWRRLSRERAYLLRPSSAYQLSFSSSEKNPQGGSQCSTVTSAYIGGYLQFVIYRSRYAPSSAQVATAASAESAIARAAEVLKKARVSHDPTTPQRSGFGTRILYPASWCCYSSAATESLQSVISIPSQQPRSSTARRRPAAASHAAAPRGE